MTALPAALATQQARIRDHRGFDPRAEIKATQRRMAMVFRARHGGTGPERSACSLDRLRRLRALLKDA